MILATLLAASFAAAVAPAPTPTGLAGQELEFRTVDGWALHGVWHKARKDRPTLVLLHGTGQRKDRPTLVLLHGTGQRKEDWKTFARALARAGCGYLAVDLRGHGESRVSPAGETLSYKKLRATKAANDYEDMTRDVEAAVSVLTSTGVPEAMIGVMGAEVGGSVAVKYAAVHARVPFVIVLSPGLAWQEMPLVNAVRAFKGRTTPILMVHAASDRRSSKETPLLYAFAKNAVGERNVTLIVVPEERGTRMLAKNRDLTGRVLDWISNPVQPEAPAVSTTPVLAPAPLE